MIVELSYQLSLRRAALGAQWIHRLQHEEADALTDFVFDRFNLGRRIPVNLDQIKRSPTLREDTCTKRTAAIAALPSLDM